MKSSSFFLSAFSLIAVSHAQVVINEIHYNSEPNTAHDEFIELHNAGAESVDVSGWFFQQGLNFTIPAGTTILSGGHLVIAEDPAAMQSRYNVASVGPFGGGLSSDGEIIELRSAAGVLIDEVDYRSRFPWPVGANGEGSSMELIDPSLDNNLGASWRSSVIPGTLPEATLIPESSAWSWRKGDTEASNPIDLWRGVTFSEDASWVSENMPIGYGGVTALTFANPIADMRNNFTSIFLRKEFTIAPGEVPTNLLLRYLIDDGIVVWINGYEIHRDNVEDGAVSISTTGIVGGNESTWSEELIANVSSFLQEGTNVIAIHAFNQSVTSSDFGLNFELIRPTPDTSAPPQ
ncbi:lamin tail domain-containing protein, partial [Akkermansiaceae bacterium]|nr:lamin tail domain-containing protein [Akkermansiaceae bacterium]